MENSLEKIDMRCPRCAQKISFQSGQLNCGECGWQAKKVGDSFSFLDSHEEIEYDATANGLRDFFKRWPSFYYFFTTVFGPVLFTGLTPEKFIRRFPASGNIINIGSGPKKISSQIVNVDLFPYPNVDIVADSRNLPIGDNSVNQIICSEVLEHISDPERVVAEIQRVLAPGGVVYFSVPFLYPFHASPHDYNRWTVAGLKELFRDFELVELGVYSGPWSALTVNLSYLVATMFSFGSARLYWLFVNVSLLFLFPLKYLDLVFAHIPGADRMAAELYGVVKKPV